MITIVLTEKVLYRFCQEEEETAVHVLYKEVPIHVVESS